MTNHISGTSQLNGTPTQARVTLINSVTNTIASSQLSNATTGQWAFPNLPAGTYEVITLIAGYKARIDGPWALDGTDTYYSNVVSLLHFDGADASTTFTDQRGRVWTPSGNAQIDTAQKKYGTAAALLDGAGDYLTTANNADFNIENNDYTIEAYVRALGAGTERAIVSKRESTSNANEYLFVIDTSNKLAFSGWNAGGATRVVILAGATALTTGDFHHVAVTKEGATWSVFLNGVLDGTVTETGAVVAKPLAVTIGRDGSSVPRYYNGWIDELRITKGVARYVNNFAPPAAAFPNS